MLILWCWFSRHSKAVVFFLFVLELTQILYYVFAILQINLCFILLSSHPHSHRLQLDILLVQNAEGWQKSFVIVTGFRIALSRLIILIIITLCSICVSLLRWCKSGIGILLRIQRMSVALFLISLVPGVCFLGKGIHYFYIVAALQKNNNRLLGSVLFFITHPAYSIIHTQPNFAAFTAYGQLFFVIFQQVVAQMQSNLSSKFAQTTSRLTSKFTESLTMPSKHNRQKANRPVEEAQVQNTNLRAIMKSKDVDQWIFGDQKMKIDSHNAVQNFPIRGRIAIHRKERVSKLNFIEDKTKPKTTDQQSTRLKCLPADQSMKEKQNHQKASLRQYSRALINRQQDNKNQLLEINVSKQFTHRYSHNPHSTIRNRKHINTSMEIYSELSHFLKPTAFSIELKKPLQNQDKIRSPKKDRIKNTINCSPKNNKYHNSYKIDNFMRRQSSVRITPQKKIDANNSNNQKQRFMLNGWEVESSMFHDFEQLYRQRSRELQRLPVDQQKNLIKRKVVRMPIH